MTRIYLDSSAIIYAMEGAPGPRSTVAQRMAEATASRGHYQTSALARAEVCVKPLREEDVGMLRRYDAFFHADELRVLAVSDAVIDLATHLRVRYRFKTPDAIHLATAIEHGADTFLTGDRQLQRCPELRVEVIDAGEEPA